MKVTTEKIDNHKVVLEITVPQEEVKKGLDLAFAKLSKKINIPGFRKGKVPRNVLISKIGKQALLEEAFDIVAPNALNKALVEQNLDPVVRPEVDIITLEEEKELVFKATIVPKPEIELGEYKNLKVEKNVEAVTEEQIQNQINNLLNNNAKMVVAENAEIKDGDFAVIDFKGFVDGEAFEGGEGKGYPLQIGSGSFIPGFEEQLVGAKAGDERDVNVVFPVEYHAPNLAGKKAMFKVTINDVKRKEMPTLDDEFVKDVSAFNTVEELKADIKANLEKVAAEKAENAVKSAALKQASDNCKVELPEVMIENRINHMIEELKSGLEGRGMKFEQYLEYVKMDLDAIRNNYREIAAENVKADLMLEAIAKAEDVKVEATDLADEVENMAKAYGATPEQVQSIIQQQGRINDLINTVVRKKAVQIILDNVAQ
ncbi:MAG: trigger factor [Negativicutes bacterium]|nr:trigger factor [Negativicutes bacterium]MBP9949790.1 trigger factor [Negativicutes bacterium]